MTAKKTDGGSSSYSGDRMTAFHDFASEQGCTLQQRTHSKFNVVHFHAATLHNTILNNSLLDNFLIYYLLLRHVSAAVLGHLQEERGFLQCVQLLCQLTW